MGKDNHGVVPLADLLRSAPMRAVSAGSAGDLVTVHAKTETGLISLVAQAENDISASQAVKLVSLDDGIEVDKFTGISRVVRRVIVHGE